MTRWKCNANSILPVGDYVLYEDAVAAVNAERERCATIARRVYDENQDAMAESVMVIFRQCYSWAAETAKEILDEIEGKP